MRGGGGRRTSPKTAGVWSNRRITTTQESSARGHGTTAVHALAVACDKLCGRVRGVARAVLSLLPWCAVPRICFFLWRVKGVVCCVVARAFVSACMAHFFYGAGVAFVETRRAQQYIVGHSKFGSIDVISTLRNVEYRSI